MRRRSFISCMRPGIALADSQVRDARTPPRPAAGDLYSELDDLLMIDAPIAQERDDTFSLQTGPLRERGR